jgi:hypothetical protein
MAERWQFVLTNNEKRPIGEILQAKEREVTLNLNKLDSAKFKVRLDNPLADALMTTSGYVKAYRDDKLQYFGPIIAAEESFDKEGIPYIGITSSSAGWVLNKRYFGKGPMGSLWVVPSMDKAAVIANGIDAVLNPEDHTGIIAHTAPYPSGGGPATNPFPVPPYTKALDLLNTTANVLDGFDWRILPAENWIGGAFVGDGQTIATFFAQETIGAERAGAIFEWGAGRNNIASYSRIVNREVQATRMFHHVVEGPDAPGYPTVIRNDTDAQAAWGLLEETAEADLHDLTLRQGLADAHLAIRKNPKQTITFTPHIDPARTGALPNYDTDYTLGDTVVARARYAGVTRFNVKVRVYAVNFKLDDNNGLERAELTLLDEGT